MRVLIDECIDERLRNFVPGHDCRTARYAGLAGMSNGDLLAAAEAAGFDVLLTVDQGIEYEQNLQGRKLAIVILCAKTNRLKDLLSSLETCLACLDSLGPGQIVRIGD